MDQYMEYEEENSILGRIRNKSLNWNREERIQNAKKLLSVIIIVVSIYLIFAPLMPAFEYYLRDWLNISYDDPIIQTRVNFGSDEGDPDLNGDTEGGGGDRILISSIGVNIPIFMGSNDNVLDKGVWLRPNGSTPEKGSNTVLTAHRFSYLNGGRSFYHLDKLKAGDEIVVKWKGEEYRYTVDESFVVTPDKIEVEAATSEPKLTLYTCTPLWTASKRLVVTASPDENTLNLISSL